MSDVEMFVIIAAIPGLLVILIYCLWPYQR